MRRLTLVIAVSAAGLLLLAAPAHAYLDPGTGSYVFQMVVAALVTAGFVLKSVWRRLRDRLRVRPPSERSGPSDAP